MDSLIQDLGKNYLFLSKHEIQALVIHVADPVSIEVNSRTIEDLRNAVKRVNEQLKKHVQMEPDWLGADEIRILEMVLGFNGKKMQTLGTACNLLSQQTGSLITPEGTSESLFTILSQLTEKVRKRMQPGRAAQPETENPSDHRTLKIDPRWWAMLRLGLHAGINPISEVELREVLGLPESMASAVEASVQQNLEASSDLREKVARASARKLFRAGTTITFEGNNGATGIKIGKRDVAQALKSLSPEQQRYAILRLGLHPELNPLPREEIEELWGMPAESGTAIESSIVHTVVSQNRR